MEVVTKVSKMKIKIIHKENVVVEVKVPFGIYFEGDIFKLPQDVQEKLALTILKFIHYAIHIKDVKVEITECSD